MSLSPDLVRLSPTFVYINSMTLPNLQSEQVRFTNLKFTHTPKCQVSKHVALLTKSYFSFRR